MTLRKAVVERGMQIEKLSIRPSGQTTHYPPTFPSSASG